MHIRRIRQLKKNLISCLLVFMVLILANYLRQKIPKPQINISKQETALNLNNKLIKLFSLGQIRLISSLIWVQTLMDSDLDHYKKKDLNSWMYLRFNSIADLDPQFYENYRYGGQYLSVIKDDDDGAKVIFEKGNLQFPNDFWLRFYTGMHYLIELKDFDNSIKHFEKIQFHPIAKRSIHYLPSIVAKLKIKKGSLEGAYEIIEIAYKNSKDNTKLKEKYYHSLYAIKAEIDLDCLNKRKPHCNKFDLDNNPYQNLKGQWKAIKKWEPVRYKH